MSTDRMLRGHDRLLRRMLAASQKFQGHLAEKTGLNMTDFVILGALDTAGEPLSAGALAQTADLTSGATTTAIDRLEKAGLVQRQRNEQDRRAVLVAIRQPNAQKLLQQIEPLISARRQLWAEFSERERQTIDRFFLRNIEFMESWSLPDKPKG